MPSSGGGVAKGSGAVFAEGGGAGAHVGKERRASGRRGEDEADIDEVDGVKGHQPGAKDMADGGRVGLGFARPADFETMTFEAARDAVKKRGIHGGGGFKPDRLGQSEELVREPRFPNRAVDLVLR